MNAPFYKIIIGFFLLEALFLGPRYLPSSIWWIVALTFFPVSIYVAKWSGLHGIASLGINFHKGWYRNIINGFLMGTGLFLIGFTIAYSCQAISINEVSSVRRILFLLIWNFAGCTIVAFAEEILMRGYVFNHLLKRCSVYWAIIISSILFTVGHFYFIGMYWPGWIRLLLFGIAMSVAYHLTKSLWVSMGIHWGWNFANYLFGFGGTDVTSMVKIQFMNEQYISWIFVGVTAFMVLIIWLFFKKNQRELIMKIGKEFS
jgi:uncharacterized protein